MGHRECGAEHHGVWDGPGRTGLSCEVEVLPDGGPRGTNSSGKVSGLENSSCFHVSLKQGVCRAGEEGRPGKESGCAYQLTGMGWVWSVSGPSIPRRCFWF